MKRLTGFCDGQRPAANWTVSGSPRNACPCSLFMASSTVTAHSTCHGQWEFLATHTTLAAQPYALLARARADLRSTTRSSDVRALARPGRTLLHVWAAVEVYERVRAVVGALLRENADRGNGDDLHRRRTPDLSKGRACYARFAGWTIDAPHSHS